MDDNDRYYLQGIDRKTINTSFKSGSEPSPDLTVQYWGQPFVASGRYYDYKYITDPIADKYHNRFHVYSDGETNASGCYNELMRIWMEPSITHLIPVTQCQGILSIWCKMGYLRAPGLPCLERRGAVIIPPAILKYFNDMGTCSIVNCSKRTYYNLKIYSYQIQYRFGLK